MPQKCVYLAFCFIVINLLVVTAARVRCSSSADCTTANSTCSDGSSDTILVRWCMCALGHAPNPTNGNCEPRQRSLVLPDMSQIPVYIAEQLGVNRDSQIKTDDGDRVKVPPAGQWMCWSDLSICHVNFGSGYIETQFNFSSASSITINSVSAAETSWKCFEESGFFPVQMPSNTTTDASAVFGGQPFDKYCVTQDAVTGLQSGISTEHSAASSSIWSSIDVTTNSSPQSVWQYGEVAWCAPGFLPVVTDLSSTESRGLGVCTRQSMQQQTVTDGLIAVGVSGTPLLSRMRVTSFVNSSFVLLETQNATAISIAAKFTPSSVYLATVPIWKCKNSSQSFFVSSRADDFTVQCNGCEDVCGTHAVCSLSNENVCVCTPGWTGDLCDRCESGTAGPNCGYSTTASSVRQCRIDACSGNGECTDRGTCHCDPGYYRSDCSGKVDTECVDELCVNSTQAKLNGARCEITSPEGGVVHCACPKSPPRYGEYCQLSASECAQTICNGNGICGVIGSGTPCICAAGYSGKYCDNLGPCLNDGQRANGSFACVCPSTWTGADCSVPLCHPGKFDTILGRCDCSGTIFDLNPTTGRCDIDMCAPSGIAAKNQQECRCFGGTSYRPRRRPFCY